MYFMKTTVEPMARRTNAAVAQPLTRGTASVSFTVFINHASPFGFETSLSAAMLA
jgi:hypothetical protein